MNGRPDGWFGGSQRALFLSPRERLAILGCFVGLGLFESFKGWVSARLAGRSIDLAAALIANMPWWLVWAALTPAIIGLARRVRPEQGWGRFVAVHATAAGALSLLHHLAAASMFYFTVTRGAMLPFRGELHPATLWIQFQIFFTTFFLLNLVTYLATLGAYYGLEFYKRYRQGELKAARLEVQTQEARLAALRMELNPHFLFNTLHSVAGLVREERGADAIAMLARLAGLLRETLEEGADPAVPLNKELELVQKYLAIEQVRFSDRLRVGVAVAEPELEDVLVPPFILQPLVENAIRHGVAKHPGPGLIDIEVRRDSGDLRMSVTNRSGGDRLGALDAGVEGKPGIGLTNTRQRLGELYGDDAELTLDRAHDGGVVASIRIPMTRVVGVRRVSTPNGTAPRWDDESAHR